MRQFRTAHYVLRFTFFLTLLLGIAVPAEAQTDSAATNLEVIILLDESGSMWRDTDPEDRRGEAVELFINALSVDASSAEYRAAIVTFGDDATLFGNGFVDIKDDAARTDLGPLSYTDVAKDFRTRADQHTVADFRVTVTLVLAGAAQGD